VRRLVAAALIFAAAGCGPNNGTAVLLTLDASALDGSSLAAIVELDFDVTGADSYFKKEPLGRSFSPSGRERTLYKAGASSGTLRFVVNALDAGGLWQGSGAADVDLESGKTVDKTLVLLAPIMGDGGEDGGDGGDGGDGSFGPPVVTPPGATVAITRAVRFSASEPVTWSVMEGIAGGSIGSDGTYWAPETPGSYHVVATSTGNPTEITTVTVTATPLQLKLLAGDIGGPGNLDGIGAEARFSTPTAACYSQGDYYVADGNNHSIRKISSFNNQQVTTVAGNGQPGDADGTGSAAQLNAPVGLDCDPLSAAMYIADSGNGKIKKMLSSTNAVSTFATGFSNPTDVLLDSANGRLLVSDSVRHQIFSVSLTNPSPVPLAGDGNDASTDNAVGLSASFSNPSALSLPAPHQLLVVDALSVRSVDLTPGNNAAVTTIWSMSSPTPSPMPFAVSSQYVADQTSLYSMNLASDQFTRVLGADQGGWADGDASTAQFFFINGLSHDAKLVLDGNIVRAINPGPSVVTLAGLQAGAQPPLGGVTLGFVVGSTVDDQGQLWLWDHAFLRRIDPVTLTNATLTPSVSPSPTPATHFAIESLAWYDGAIYATDVTVLERIDPVTGVATIAAGSTNPPDYVDDVGTAARFGGLGYLASDGKGTIYISDTENNIIRIFDVATGRVSTLAGHKGAGSDDAVGTAASFSRPDQIVLDGHGALYVADRGNNVIRKIDLATRAVSRFAGAFGQGGTTDGSLDQARFQAPWGLACDGHSLYVSNLYSTGNVPAEAAVRRIDLASGRVSHFVGSDTLQGIRLGALPGSLSTSGNTVPLNVQVMPGGDLLIVDQRALLLVQP
jgi:hypothetical protein